MLEQHAYMHNMGPKSCIATADNAAEESASIVDKCEVLQFTSRGDAESWNCLSCSVQSKSHDRTEK